MPVADSLGARLIRIFMLLCGLIYAYGFWVNRSLAFTDFRVLHLGAGLINDGRTDEAYDADAFTAAAAAHPELGSTARELDVFISTPPFAMAMQPFAWLSSNTALVVWMVLGVAAVFAAVKVLRLPAWAGLIALVMPLGVANIYHAQTGFLALLWAAVIHRLCVDGKNRSCWFGCRFGCAQANASPRRCSVVVAGLASLVSRAAVGVRSRYSADDPDGCGRLGLVAIVLWST